MRTRITFSKENRVVQSKCIANIFDMSLSDAKRMVDNGVIEMETTRESLKGLEIMQICLLDGPSVEIMEED